GQAGPRGATGAAQIHGIPPMKLAGRQVIESRHPCLADHFPERAIVPAVVLLECVLEALDGGSDQKHVITFPAVKFLAPLKPDQPFSVYRDAASRGRVRFECRCAEQVIARGELDVGAGRDPTAV
ncbi:MAG: hypothetical protein ACRED0_08415, partial [Gammaproteobacteria bacterium]